MTNNTTTTQSTTTDADAVLPEGQKLSDLSNTELLDTIAGLTEGNSEVEEKVEEAPAPRNIQRMTIQVPIDVDMGKFEEIFAVKGWSPTREFLVGHVLEVLLEDEDLAAAAAHINTK
jgi:hypothetical protein